MWGMSDPDLCPTWRRFFFFHGFTAKKGSDVSRELEVQGVQGRVRTRRRLFLRTVLRPARGQLRPLGPGRGGGEAADPGRFAGDLALRRLPALLRSPRGPAGAGPDAAAEGRPAGRAVGSRR